MAARSKSDALSACLLTVFLSSCAELKVDRDNIDGIADLPPQSKPALTYNLPETLIAVSGTITLNDCDNIIAQALVDDDNKRADAAHDAAVTAAASAAAVAAANNKPAPPPVKPVVHETLPDDMPPVDITEAITVVPYTQPDSTKQYRIPYSKLEGWSKQLSLTIGRNPNKTLTSINGAITDQAGPTILAAANAAISIAGAVAIPEVGIPVALGRAGAAAAQPAAPADMIARSLKQIGYALEERQVAAINKIQKSKLTIDDVAKALKLTEPADLNLVKQAIRKATTNTVCNQSVTKAMNEIAVQQVIIAGAAASASGGGQQSTGGGGSQPGGNQPNPAVVRAQARIASLVAEYQLSRHFNITWRPARQDIMLPEPAYVSWYLEKTFDMYDAVIAPNWLANSDTKTWAKKSQENPSLKALTSVLKLQLYVRPWTVGRDFGEPVRFKGVDPDASKARGGGQSTSNRSDENPQRLNLDGIVYRDPAIALLRTCLGPCGGQLRATTPGPQTPPPLNPAVPTDPIDNETIDTTGDLSPAIVVPIVQFGRVYVQPLHNVLFQTSSVTLSVNADGSIASVGTQSSNASASGFGALTMAGSAQAAAVAAHNTAIGAQNTAATTAATWADTQNKALVDCLNQAATLGKNAVPCVASP